MATQWQPVSRVGKPGLARENPSYDDIFIRLEIWPSPPGDSWWDAFLGMARERAVRFAVDATPQQIVALAQHSIAVKSVVLAIDSAIAYANDWHQAELEKLDPRDARHSQAELDAIADELQKPDPREAGR